MSICQKWNLCDLLIYSSEVILTLQPEDRINKDVHFRVLFAGYFSIIFYRGQLYYMRLNFAGMNKKRCSISVYFLAVRLLMSLRKVIYPVFSYSSQFSCFHHQDNISNQMSYCYFKSKIYFLSLLQTFTPIFRTYQVFCYIPPWHSLYNHISEFLLDCPNQVL